MQLNRRRFLSGLSPTIVGLSGCVGVIGGTTDISISNEASDRVAAGIKVTRTSGGPEDVLISDRFGLLSGESKEYEEVVDDAQVLIEADARQGSDTIDYVKYVWSDTTEDTEGTDIEITANSIEISGSGEVINR
ncbi:hypothetical protein [Halorubrum coriense]|uniref:hypothetical protein n=1 Tax=Halorubrum coriense TaxID=64713 RepID=UPI001268E559|nr:hypothetical protein [Halorubrum coriense]